jgi:hypothetical protein
MDILGRFANHSIAELGALLWRPIRDRASEEWRPAVDRRHATEGSPLSSRLSPWEIRAAIEASGITVPRSSVNECLRRRSTGG